MPVIIEPHATHRLEAHHRAQQGSDERHKSVKHWDRAGDNIGNDGNAEGAGEPNGPVRDGITDEVFGAAKQMDEDIFRWDL